MMQFIPGLPEYVLAVQGTGTVTDEDYKKVLIPAAEAKIHKFGKVSCLYHLGPGFEGFEAKAMWDDAMVGLKHRKNWDKIAIVTDADWVRHAVNMLSFMVAGPISVFPNADLAKAKAWVAEPAAHA